VSRVFGILLHPQATWSEIRKEDPGWTKAFFAYACPLALLPAVTWPLGRAWQGAPESVLASALATFLLGLACVILLACGFYVLAPLFAAARNWRRSLALACYASTPVFLCGAVLIVPLLVIASVGAFLYGLGICSAGIPVMLDCKGDVAAYLASASVFFGASSMALGALCSAIGLI